MKLCISNINYCIMKETKHSWFQQPVKWVFTHFTAIIFTFLFFLGSFIQSTATDHHSNAMQVSGRITGPDGKGLAGVSIVEKGTNNGTTSKDDGNYSITVANDNAILVITAVGYTAMELTVKGKPVLNVSMELLNSELTQVVVVGYGTQKKIDVTGAVSRVNLEAMGNAPNTNIGQFLQGTVPGLNVGLSTFAGGTPPISIRGRVTLQW